MTAIARHQINAGMRAQLDAFFASLGQGVNAYLTSKGRLEEIKKLNALSDRELGAMGLARSDISRHVFRDIFDI